MMDSDTTGLTLKLRRTVEKKLRYQSHADFLRRCSDNVIIPKGFRIKKEVQLDLDSSELDIVRRIKEDAALKIMDVALSACRRKCEELEKGIDKEFGLLSTEEQTGIITWGEKEHCRFTDLKNKKWRSLNKQRARYRDKPSFDVVNINKDGNCFYRCLSQWLYGSQMRHIDIREELVRYMMSEPCRYSMYIDGDVSEHLRHQLQSNGRVYTWATEAELQAAADFYRIKIHVSLNRCFDDWLSFSSDGVRYDDNNTVRLLLEREHFSFLRTCKLDQNSAVRCSDRTFFDWFDMSETAVDEGSQIGGDHGCNTHTRDKRVRYNSDVNTDTGRMNSKPQIDPKRRVKHRGNDSKGPRSGSCRLKSVNKHKKPDEVVSSVLNLSRYELTEPQKSLLEKGLKFVPSKNRVDKVKLLADLGEWERRMRLREYFFEKDKPDSADDKESVQFKSVNKSSFTPTPGRDRHLDTYIEVVKNDITMSLKKKGRLNLSKEENSAFHELLHNDDIIIRPADKGSGIVIMDKDTYISSLKHEVEGNVAYEASENDLTVKSTKVVKKLVNKMYRNGAISDDLKKYMQPRYTQPGKLKGNPKIHKANNPLRTIVSGINSATENIAEVAEHELDEYVRTSPSFLKDTTDFLNNLTNIPQPLPENSLLFCFDVCKLYPSIPKAEGLEACKEALEARSKPLIPTKEVMEMITTVLENNNFSLGDNHYLQTDGVAIGSKLGKNFACTYMRKWDERLLSGSNQPSFYKRFIDDGFGVWTGDEESLLAFSDYANSIHKNIKVELRYSKSSIEFLDTLVKIENGYLSTDIYQKPSDKHLYLNSKSCHPPNVKRSIAYGLGIRLKRICQEEADYRKHRKELKTQLRHRGYSGSFIERQLRKVDKMDRADLLCYKTRQQQKKPRVPLVLTFSNMLPDIHHITKKYMSILHQSSRMRDVFADPPLISYRRDRNLNDTLVHSKTNRMIRCSASVCQEGCLMCADLKIDAIPDAEGEGSFPTVKNISCKERNVVYGILCVLCNKTVYVGETEREARERFREHERDIRLCKDKPINAHFADSGHTSHTAKFVIVERCYSMARIERQIRESIWIDRLNSYRPHGCNIKNSAMLAPGLARIL